MVGLAGGAFVLYRGCQVLVRGVGFGGDAIMSISCGLAFRGR